MSYVVKVTTNVYTRSKLKLGHNKLTIDLFHKNKQPRDCINLLCNLV